MKTTRYGLLTHKPRLISPDAEALRRGLLLERLFMLAVIVATCLLCSYRTLAEPPVRDNDAPLRIASLDTRPITIDRLIYSALKEVGMRSSFTSLPYAEGCSSANSFEIDGIIASSSNLDKSYENLIKVPVLLERADIYAVTKEGSPTVADWDDLAGLRVGVISQSPFVTDNIPASSFAVTAETNADLMDRLLCGECDAALVTIRWHETIELKKGLVFAGRIDTLDEYLYLNKRSGSLVPALAGILENMFESGQAEKILMDEMPAEAAQKRTVLHILSSGLDEPDEESFVAELRNRFTDDDSLEWYTLELNSNRFAPEATRIMSHERLLRQDLVSKDVAAVVISGADAFEFVKDYYFLLFRNTPVLYYRLCEKYDTDLGEKEQFFTGLTEGVSAYETVSAALELFPGTESIFVVNGSTTEGRLYRNEIARQLTPFENQLKIEYNENVSREALLGQIKSLPENAVVLVGSYSLDGNGQYYTQGDMKRAFESNAEVPVFSVGKTNLGYNALGGKCKDYERAAVMVADRLEELLGGASPTELPVIFTSEFNRWVFDKASLAQFGIPERKLPVGSHVINVTPSIWETDPKFALTLVALLVLGIAAVAGFSLFLYHFNRQKERIRNAEALLERDEKIKEVKERLENIINTAPVSLIMAVDGIIVEANEYSRNFLGAKPGESILGIYTDANFCEHLASKADRQKVVKHEIARHNMASGESHRFLTNVTTTEYEKKQAHILWGVDIEESERQKDSLKSSRRRNRSVTSRLERIIITSPFIFLISIDGIVIEMNKNARDTLGFDVGSALGNAYVEASERDVVYKRVLDNGSVRNEPVRLRFTDGKVHRCLINAALTDYDGRTAVVIWAVDMEENELQKDRLDAASRSLQTILDTMPAAVGIAEADSYEVVYSNKALLNLFGLEGYHSLYGTSVANIQSRIEGTASVMDFCAALTESGENASNDLLIQSSSGNLVNARVNAAPITYNGRNAIIGIFTDLTAEIEYKSMQETLRKILDTMPAPLGIIVSETSELVYGNNEYVKLHGYDSFSDLAGMPVFKTLVPIQSSGISAEDLCDVLIAKGETDEAEIQIRTADGEAVDVRIITAPIQYNGKSAVVGILTDLTREKKYRLMQENLQAVLDTMPIPVRLLDIVSLSVIYANQSYMDLFGYKSLKEACRPIIKAMPTIQSNGLHSNELIEYFKSISDTFSMEVDYITTDGKLLNTFLTSVKIDYNSRETSVGIIRDLAEQKEYERRLFAAAEKEKEANQLKSRFLVNMSHEIRTPMNVIIGLTEIELRKALPNETKTIYKKIMDSAKNLIDIINDILDLSKIEENKIELYFDEFELENVLSDALLVAAPRLDGKNVELILDEDLNLPRFLIGDNTKLWQILKNFLDNSAKFTENGKVALTVAENASLSSDDTVSITFTIEDTGIGMDDEQINRVFEPYERVYSNAQKRYTGTGLGMAISKKLCELMGGSLSIDSEPDKGTAIRITIPFMRSQNTETAGSAIKSDILTGKQVLAIDDGELSLSILQRIISAGGANCTTAISGEEALEIIAGKRENKGDFDLILIDYMMKGLNGVETADRIQAGLSWAPKLLITTASQRHEHKSEIEKGKLYDVIEKPLLPTQLIKKMGETLGADGGKAMKECDTLAEFKGVTALLCEDYELNQEVAIGMFEQFGVSTVIAENGREGIDKLRSSMESGGDAKKIDIIFMDLQMPVMDGYEAARIIRSDKSFDRIPIISLTADAMKEVAARCVESGMDDYVAKPLEFANLQEIFLKWLPSDKRVTTEKQQNLSSTEPFDAGLARFGGDKERFENALLELSGDLPDDWPEFNSFVENMEEIKRFIHKIKGAAGNLSETVLYDCAAEFERELKNNAPSEKLYRRMVEASSSFKKRCSGLMLERDKPPSIPGSDDEFREKLEALKNALSGFDILEIASSLEALKRKSWPSANAESLNELYRLTQSYEYFDALEFLEKMQAE